MQWKPSIGSILSTSGMITLFLGLLVFLICFAHASSSPSLPEINSLIESYTGTSNYQMTTIGLAFIEAQLWIPKAAFGTLEFIDIELPPMFLYYLAAIGAGFLASLIFLRKESRLIDSLIAPLISATYLLVAMLVLGLIVQSLLASYETMLSGTQFNLTLSASGYVMIFLINWMFFTIGSFSAAALKEFIHYMWRSSPNTKPIKRGKK